MKIFDLQQTSYHLHESFIFTLNYSILLWSIGYGILPLNSMLLAKNNKLIRSIISPSITSYTFYYVLTIIFNKIFEFLKTPKWLIFMFDKINPTHPTKIINKSKKIGIHTNII